MSQYTEDKLGCKVSQNGMKKLLKNQAFSNVSFDEFILGPVLDSAQELQLADVSFENCKVGPGLFAIRAGVVLDRVIFSNMNSVDSMIVSTNALLNNVTLKGHPKKGGLWVRPDEVFNEARDAQLKNWIGSQSASIDWMLDITEYVADHVEILGLPVEKIKYNPERHVGICQDLNESVNWSELGIAPTSFWRLALRRLRSFHVDAGVFGLPLESDKYYEKTMLEMDRIIETGKLADPRGTSNIPL